MKFLNQKSAYRMLCACLIYLLGLAAGHESNVQQSLARVKAEISAIEKGPVKSEDIDRLLVLTTILLDSAQYDDLLRLYQFAFDESRKIGYVNGELISMARLVGEYSELSDYEAVVAMSDTLISHKSIGDSLKKVALVSQGTALSVLSDFSRAIDVLELAVTIDISLENEMDLYDYLSYSYSGQGVYDKAMAYCFQALELLQLEEPKQYHYISQFYHNLGLIQYKNGELEEAIEYYRKALDINIKFEKEGKAPSIVQDKVKFAGSKRIPIYMEIGLVYRELVERDSAMAYFKKAGRLSETVNGRNRLIQAAAIGINLADLYNELNHYDSALYQLNLISDSFDNGPLGSYAQYVSYLVARGISLRGMGRLKEALSAMRQAEAKAKELKVEDENIIYDLYQAISSTLEESGQFEASLDYFKQAHVHRDSLYNEEKTKVIKELEAKYLSAEKEREIALIEKEQARLRSQMILLSVGGGLLLILAILLYRFYKVKRHDNRLLAHKNQEIRNKNEHLQELSKFKEGLTHMIAHDMKNPLNVVIGLADGVPDDMAMSQIRQSGELMLQLITNMLDIQKFEEAKMPIELTHFSLLSLVNEVEAQVKLLLDAKHIQLINEVDKEVFVFADRILISRVLVNLCTNAIKYSHVSGKISISSEMGEERVFIKVSDNGKGIPVEVQPFIFDKFWQSDALASGITQSTGLGLTFCNLAVKGHQGRIRVNSKPGAGSEFTFDLSPGNALKLEELEAQESLPRLSPAISEQELLLLEKSIAQISKLPLYQFGEIQRILKTIEEKSEAISNWKEELMSAVINWDQKRFSELLELEHQ